MRIGFDIDGVLYPFVPAIRQWMTWQRGRDPQTMPNPTTWHFAAEWGMTDAELLAELNEASNAGFLNNVGDPYPGTIESMRRLANAGHTIHLVTARNFGDPGVAERGTVRWLTRHRAPYDSLTFSRTKAIVAVDHFIDDNLGNYDELDAAGHNPHLLDWLYNRTEGCTRRRVQTVSEFASIILGEPNQRPSFVAA